MQQPALFDQILAKIRTTSELSLVLSCLAEFLDTFFTPKKLEDQQKIFHKLPSELASIFIKAFASEQIIPESQIRIKREIDELTDKLHGCKTLQLTIAFQANEETISYFSEWIKKNVRTDLLIDLQYDKTIVGGVLIIVDGTYKDYSVKKNLSNRFQIQKEDILGLLD
jgi:F0F1-type ATP synthase delta subunit